LTQRRLDILTTGGTIASRTKGPMATGDEVANELHRFFPDVEIGVREICRLSSSQITTNVLWEIGAEAKKSFLDGADGVVVTHGTGTLEETAYFLDLIGGSNGQDGEVSVSPEAEALPAPSAEPVTEDVQESDEESTYGTPIRVEGVISGAAARIAFGPTVVTGAMRGFDAVGYDGLANLVESCQVALEPASAEYGVLVVMNDRIHLAREVTKVHSWLLDAFASPGLGPVGSVGQEGVTYTVKPPARSHVEYTALVPPVDLIKSGLASGDRLVRALVKAGTRGLVVESLGHGHLPPGMVEALQHAVKDNIPVVITTRCLSGGAPNPGTVDDLGFVTTDLSGPKARIKLMLVLSVTNDPDEIAKMFGQRP
jgi:L-asparaginase/Glu-tRNA(Gln) amidotransferase subunit D